MSDTDVQKLKKTLEREQKNPREVALQLLGEEATRYLLLVRASPNDSPDMWRGGRPITAIRDGGDWWAMHAFPIATVVDLISCMKGYHGRIRTLWDVAGNRVELLAVSNMVSQPAAIEEGWRTPRDGPPVFVNEGPFLRPNLYSCSSCTATALALVEGYVTRCPRGHGPMPVTRRNLSEAEVRGRIDSGELLRMPPGLVEAARAERQHEREARGVGVLLARCTYTARGVERCALAQGHGGDCRP